MSGKSNVSKWLSLLLTVALIAASFAFAAIPVSAEGEENTDPNVVADVDFTTRGTGASVFVAGSDGSEEGMSPANIHRQISDGNGETQFYMSSGYNDDSTDSKMKPKSYTAQIIEGTGLKLMAEAYSSGTTSYGQARKADYAPDGFADSGFTKGIANLSNDYKLTVEGGIGSVNGVGDIRFNTSADGKSFYFIRFDGNYNGTEKNSKPAWHLYKCVDGVVGRPVLESKQIPYSYNTTYIKSFTLNITKKGATIKVGVIGYNGDTMVEDGTPLTWEDPIPFTYDAKEGGVSFLALSNGGTHEFVVKKFSMENIPELTEEIVNQDFTQMNGEAYFIAGTDGSGTGTAPANLRKQMYDGETATDFYFSSGFGNDSASAGTTWQIKHTGQFVQGTGLVLSYGGGNAQPFGTNDYQRRYVVYAPNGAHKGISKLSENYKFTVTGETGTNANGGAEIRFHVSKDGKNYYAIRMASYITDVPVWGVYKCVGGILDTTPVFASSKIKTNYYKDFNLTVTKKGATISLEISEGGESNKESARWTDPNPFTYAASESNIGFVDGAKNVTGNTSTYKTFCLENFAPWAEEPDNAIYVDITGEVKGGIMSIDNMPVRKIVNNGDTAAEILVSENGSDFQPIGTAEPGGKLMNGLLEEPKIKALKAEGGGDITVYTDLASFKVTALEQGIPLKVRLGGADVDSATITSSDESIATIKDNDLFALRNGTATISATDGTNTANATVTVNGSYAVNFELVPPLKERQVNTQPDPIPVADGWTMYPNPNLTNKNQTIKINKAGLSLTSTTVDDGAEAARHPLLKFEKIPEEIPTRNQTIHFVAGKGSVNTGIIFRFMGSGNTFYTLSFFAANNRKIAGSASKGIFAFAKVVDNKVTDIVNGPVWEGDTDKSPYGCAINTDVDVTVDITDDTVSWSVTAGRYTQDGIQTWQGSFVDPEPLLANDYCGFAVVNTNSGTMVLRDFSIEERTKDNEIAIRTDKDGNRIAFVNTTGMTPATKPEMLVVGYGEGNEKQSAERYTLNKDIEVNQIVIDPMNEDYFYKAYLWDIDNNIEPLTKYGYYINK